jgi:NTE family protein
VAQAPNRKIVGLALGSGGGRGIAHVGVLKALVRHNIPIDRIAGTSIGAWAGAFYAIHGDIAALEEKTLGYKRDKLIAMFEPSRQAMIKGKKVERLLRDWLGDLRFEDLKIPTAAVATDLITGREVDFMSGPIVPAVRASMSVPLLFEPVRYEGKLLSDGGLVNPVPDNVVRAMGADVVIAVNLDKYLTVKDFDPSNLTLSSTALRSLNIIRHYLADYSLHRPDINISPDIDTAGLKLWKQYFTDTNLRHLMDIGEAATESQIDAIKQLVFGEPGLD